MLRIEEHQFGVLRDLQKIREQCSWRTNFTLKIEEHLFGVQQDLQKIREQCSWRTNFMLRIAERQLSVLQDLQKIREQCSWRTHFMLKIKEPSQLIDTRFTEPTYSDITPVLKNLILGANDITKMTQNAKMAFHLSRRWIGLKICRTL